MLFGNIHVRKYNTKASHVCFPGPVLEYVWNIVKYDAELRCEVFSEVFPGESQPGSDVVNAEDGKKRQISLVCVWSRSILVSLSRPGGAPGMYSREYGAVQTSSSE